MQLFFSARKACTALSAFRQFEQETDEASSSRSGGSTWPSPSVASLHSSFPPSFFICRVRLGWYHQTRSSAPPPRQNSKIYSIKHTTTHDHQAATAKVIWLQRQERNGKQNKVSLRREASRTQETKISIVQSKKYVKVK
jgi:hypothetical protein